VTIRDGAGQFVGDDPAAASAKVLDDRRELALVAVERTRMPMVVSNPRLPDNPIVLANNAFLELSGYPAEEVIGRNCRFLQGGNTDPRQVAKIREGIAAQTEVTVELLNYRKDGSSFWNEVFISPVHDDEGVLLYHFASSKDVSKRVQARELELEEHRLLLEIDHRAKNALALVQGFVRLSRSDDAEAYAASVQSRVDAVARAHTMLAIYGWRGVPLTALIDGEAERFDSRRVITSGPDVPVGSRQVQPLGLVLHELLANAAKHGALSSNAGKVSISWDYNGQDSLFIHWRETGGPAPEKERPRHLGSMLIEQIIQRQLNGKALFDWKPTGLEAQFSFEVNSVDAERPAASK
jgi:PAS domain S-box-containing protein